MLLFIINFLENTDKNEDNKPLSYSHILKIQLTISYKYNLYISLDILL